MEKNPKTRRGNPQIGSSKHNIKKCWEILRTKKSLQSTISGNECFAPHQSFGF